MTPERIKELRTICDAATPGPWSVSFGEDEIGSMVYGLEEVEEFTSRDSLDFQQVNADWSFIAASRTALPEALDEIERLQARVEELDALLRTGDEIHAAQCEEMNSSIDRLKLIACPLQVTR